MRVSIIFAAALVLGACASSSTLMSRCDELRRVVREADETGNPGWYTAPDCDAAVIVCMEDYVQTVCSA